MSVMTHIASNGDPGALLDFVGSVVVQRVSGASKWLCPVSTTRFRNKGRRIMSDSQSILSSVLELGRDLPSQELPSFLGKLEEIRVTALARLQTPAAQAKQEDRLLNTAEAAERLGVSEHYLRR